MRPRILLKITLGIAVLSLAGLAAQAEDKDAKYYEAQFSRWTSEIAKLQRSDKQGAGVEAIEKLRTQLGQAQALAAAEKFREIAPIEEHLNVSLRFNQMWLDRLSREADANAAEEAASKAEAVAAEAKAQSDAKKKQYDELEAKGL